MIDVEYINGTGPQGTASQAKPQGVLRLMLLSELTDDVVA